MRRYLRSIFCLLLIVGGCTAPRPPQTPAIPVTNTYHGVQVTDPYRWLEDWSDKRVQSWSNRQNAYARSVLDNLPCVRELRARVTEILTARSVSYYSLLAGRNALRHEASAAVAAAPAGGHAVGG
jgi:prolyl oligopeptidase